MYFRFYFRKPYSEKNYLCGFQLEIFYLELSLYLTTDFISFYMTRKDLLYNYKLHKEWLKDAYNLPNHYQQWVKNIKESEKIQELLRPSRPLDYDY
jgi:hypothetical protein